MFACSLCSYKGYVLSDSNAGNAGNAVTIVL